MITYFEAPPYKVAECGDCGSFQPVGSSGVFWEGEPECFTSRHIHADPDNCRQGTLYEALEVQDDN